ncbi:MAG TPA: hypothetical protein VEQ41_09925 [Solirubrobacterales bacterium]|nr:hypothetical protein [Solirubrobacterales bacterium]
MSRPPSDDEAVAIAAAIQRFLAETSAPAGGEPRQRTSPWHRAALLEGVGKRVTLEDLEGEGGGRWPS